MKKKLKIEIEQEALKEIDQGYEWYEKKLTGLGSEFKEEVDNSFKLILSSSNGYKKFGKHRQFPLNRFPYVILYEITKSVLYIDAVFHTSQDPKKKTSR